MSFIGQFCYWLLGTALCKTLFPLAAIYLSGFCLFCYLSFSFVYWIIYKKGFKILSSNPLIFLFLPFIYISHLENFSNFFFCFLMAAPIGMWKFPSQGSNPSHSCDLCPSFSNTGSSTHCTRAGIKSRPLQWPEPLQSDP